MTSSGDPAEFYRDLGVKPVISASGTVTAYGGSKLRPEVMDVMNRAATTMVNMDELNRPRARSLQKLPAQRLGSYAAEPLAA